MHFIDTRCQRDADPQHLTISLIGTDVSLHVWFRVLALSELN
jgi:hypothetical protein